MATLLDDLNAKFALPNSALTFTAGEGGLPCAVISTPACSGKVYLQGAHVTHFQPVGQKPLLFMSAQSVFAPGKPIRGGVPICYPWFGANAADPASPMHGFARLLQWEVEASRLGDGGKVAIVFVLKSSPETKKYWPFDFELRHRLTFGQQLIMKLETTNTSAAPLQIAEALHTYFAVGDVRQTKVLGLEDTTYIDKMDNMATKRQAGPVTITAETDRVYLPTAAATVLEDAALQRRITIEKHDSNATVVWNPWVAKAKAMADFGDEEWPAMLCIETCNVAAAQVTVPPGVVHQMRATISVAPLV